MGQQVGRALSAPVPSTESYRFECCLCRRARSCLWPDAHRITIKIRKACQLHQPSELDVTVHENTLLVTGKAQKEEEKKNGNGYLHRGIARRAFERRFSLADHMKVTGAKLDNGMLHVDLVHEVPEAAKPRKIAIGTNGEPVQPQVTQQKAA